MNKGKGSNSVRFIHLTDPHLTHLNNTSFAQQKGKRRLGYLSWKRKRQKIHLSRILDKLSQAVQSEHADQILITGDLVHICLPEEIHQAKNWLESLGSAEQITLVPGNHDVYQKECWLQISDSWKDFLGLPGKAFTEVQNNIPGASYPLQKRFENFNLISLSSVEAMPIFSAQGRIREDQFNRLEKILCHCADNNVPTGWLLHHPPLPGLTAKRRALKDASALKKLIERYQPAFVLHGHNHRNMLNVVNGSQIFGTASASCTYDASYRVLDLIDNSEGLQIKMSLKQYQAEQKHFVETQSLDWHVGGTN